MKSRILLFLGLTVCCTAQVRPTAVRGRAYAWDEKLSVGTAAASPLAFPVSAILPRGSTTVENGNAFKVIVPVAIMTARGLSTVPNVFSDAGEMLGETSGLPSPEIRSGYVAQDEPVRNAVEPRATVALPIKISDVTGLSAALSQMNNSVDTLNTRVNDLSATVSNLSTKVDDLSTTLNTLSAKVDNLSTTVNALGDTVANLVRVPTYVDFELPVGSMDGTNPVFVLNAAPTPPASLTLYRNGIKLSPGFDYSISANTILFATGAVPQPGDLVTARYRMTANPSAAVIVH
jgi:outer membrane murein-binding lipoprotein Lpp